MAAQVVISATEIRGRGLVMSHPTGVSMTPIDNRNSLTNPVWESMNFQRLPETTGGRAQARTRMASSPRLMRVSRFNATAVAKPPPTPNTTTMSMKTRVFVSANWKSGLAAISWKFCRPTNGHSRRRVADVTSVTLIRSITRSG